MRRLMDDAARTRRAKYDAIGRTLCAFGPLVATFVSFARWLLNALTGETILTLLGAVVFAALFTITALWAGFVLRRGNANTKSPMTD
jgi:hypothetical protein